MEQKEEESKSFQQFSSTLVSLCLKSKTNKENNTSRVNRYSVNPSTKDNENTKTEPDDLEALLNQLKTQKDLVKETMSYREKTNVIINSQSQRTYTNAPTLTPQTHSNTIHVNNLIEQYHQNNIGNNEEYENDNETNQIKQRNKKVPLIQSITIEDDLNDDNQQSTLNGINQNKTEHIPIMTSIPLINASITSQENYNQLKTPSKSINNMIQSIPVYEEMGQKADIKENDEFNEEQQIDNNPKGKLKEVKKDKNTPIKKNDQLQSSAKKYVNVQTPSPNQKSYNANTPSSSIENKESLDQNNFIVEVNDSDGSDHDTDKKDLDYYSKSLKRKTGNLKTQEIHDIEEVKGESEDEEENNPPQATNPVHEYKDDEFNDKDHDNEEIQKPTIAPVIKKEVIPKKKESNNESASNIAIIIEDIDDIPEMKLEIMEIEEAIIPAKINDKPRKSSKDTKTNNKPKTETKKDNPNQNKTNIKEEPSLSSNRTAEKNSSANKSINKTQPKGNKVPTSNAIKHKREAILQAIDDFDITNPDLSGKYTQIQDFNGRDKTLLKMIPNYQDIIIKPEGNGIFLKRREAFLTHRFFESKMECNDDTNNDFIIFLQKVKYPYPKLIISNYQQLKDKTGLFPKQSTIDELFISKSNPNSFAIGPIESISTFFYKYSMNLFTDLMDAALGTFTSWRQVKADGNSFYRVIMFSILEKLILSNQIERIEMICNEINNMKDFYKTKNVDYENGLAVLKIIIDLMNQEEIPEAYEIFIKAYNTMKGNVFDKTLGFYLRKIAYNYIDETLHVIKSEVKKMGAKMNNDLVFNDIAVLEDYIEPEFDIIAMVKYLFNTELEFFWVDGDFNKPQFGRSRMTNENLTKHINIKEQFTIPKIYIGFFYLSYYIIYPTDSHIDSSILRDKISNGITTFTQLIHITKEEKKCEKCEKKSPHIYFLLKGVFVCLSCLRNFVGKVLKERAKNYALANFVSIEYYTRSIQLTSTVYLNNYEFIEIELKQNLNDRILSLVKDTCFECGELINSKTKKTTQDNSPTSPNQGKNELKCMCLYCNKCLWDTQLRATSGLKVINSFEKFKFTKIQCCCNQPFNTEEGQRFCKQITQEDIDNAILRMTRYINTKCFVCVKRSVDPEHMSDFQLIKIKEEDGKNKGIDYFDGPHTICNDCFKLEKANIHFDTAAKNTEEEDQSKKNTENVDNEIKMIFCNICRKEHQTDKSQWGNITKQHNACCNEGCIIF